MLTCPYKVFPPEPNLALESSLLGLAPKKTGKPRLRCKVCFNAILRRGQRHARWGTTNNSRKNHRNPTGWLLQKSGINSPVEEEVVYIPLLRRFQKHLYYTKRLFSRRIPEPSTSMCHVSWISILTSNWSSMHHYDMLGNWCTILTTLFDVISCVICDIIMICNNIWYIIYTHTYYIYVYIYYIHKSVVEQNFMYTHTC